MTHARTTNSRALPWLVLSDFDETFWAHDPTQHDDKALQQLVALLASPASAPVVFGFITGSAAITVRDRLVSLTQDVPVRFIGGNLGTELLVESEGILVPEPQWSLRMPPPLLHAERVKEFVGAARQAGVDLIDQATNGQATFKANYYLMAATENLDEDPRVYGLYVMAHRSGLNINVNHCNPAAGDPEGFLDVDVIPTNTGKSSVAGHLQALWGIPRQRTIAFGDSGNDIELLSCAQHSWLVANATSEARRRHPRITRRPRLAGIVDSINYVMSKETS